MIAIMGTVEKALATFRFAPCTSGVPFRHLFLHSTKTRLPANTGCSEQGRGTYSSTVSWAVSFTPPSEIGLL